MSLERLNDLITKTAKALYDNEKFAVGVLAVRAQKAAQSCPTDQTLVGMANFLTKRAASSRSSFITRAELKDVYNKLYSPSNKFVVVFAEELGVKEAPKPKGMTRDPNEGKNLVDEAYNKYADPVLSNALSNIFDKNPTLKLYSNATAISAQKSCAFELERQGFSPKKIDVVAGQADLLICQATYDTPCGEGHMLVPVEIKQEKALLPTMFLSRAGFMDLKPQAIEEHLLKTAGKRHTVDVQKLLEVVATAKNGAPETVSEVEQIIIKVAAAKGTPASYDMANGIIYQEVDKPILDVAEAQYEQPEEIQLFAKRMTSAAGVAEFTLGKHAVGMGRTLVSSLLSKFGYTNAQVAVADSNEDTIFYAVAIESGTSFKVPVKIESNKRGERSRILEPSIIIADGKVTEFSKQAISQLLSEGVRDYKASMMASPLYDLKPAELVHEIKTAMLDGNYRQAEDVLDILKASNDDKAFRVGFDLYMQGLKSTPTDLKKEASVKDHSGCKHQYKTASSKYMMCGHTNLPTHRVYQDKNGDCQPLYRKGMDETSEGASFLHSRIYMG